MGILSEDVGTGGEELNLGGYLVPGIQVDAGRVIAMVEMVIAGLRAGVGGQTGRLVIEPGRFGWKIGEYGDEVFFEPRTVVSVDDIVYSCGCLGHGECECVEDHNVKVICGFIRECSRICSGEEVLMELEGRVRSGYSIVRGARGLYGMIGRMVSLYSGVVSRWELQFSGSDVGGGCRCSGD